MNNNAYVEDLIERYIYQVAKRIQGNKKDIEDELRTLIFDMLDERVGDRPYTKKDIEIILMELGSPNELAAKYNNNKRCLIGPNLYPQYIFILKIVLLAVSLGITIATFIGAFTEYQAFTIHIIGEWFINMFTALTGAFSWLTVIFAVLEWRGININFNSSSFINELPPVPVKSARIGKAEPIVGIVFTVIFFIIFCFAPYLLGAYIVTDTVKVIPIFNIEVINQVLPLFVLSFILGILKEAITLIEGKYTLRLAVATTIINVISLTLILIIFTGFPIWNPNFTSEIGSYINLTSEFNYIKLFEIFNSCFISILIFAYALETGTMIFKAFKHHNV